MIMLLVLRISSASKTFITENKAKDMSKMLVIARFKWESRYLRTHKWNK